MNGITAFLNWGIADNGVQGPCVEAACNWYLDPTFRSYISGPSNNGLKSHGQKLNLVITIIAENGSSSSNGIPSYVFMPITYNPPGLGWCIGCAAQDVVTCGGWTGANSAPTCTQSGSNNQCKTPQNGVWNASTCRVTGSSGSGNCANEGEVGTDFSGYPVLYEKPLMTAYQDFISTVFTHYTTGLGKDIGPYIGYIRIGLAEGGENQPFCTVQSNNNGQSYTGIWPSPGGLLYDLNPANNTAPDWYTTTGTCLNDAECQGKYAYIAGNPGGSQHDATGFVQTMFDNFYANLKALAYPWQIMANIHDGPPNNQDTDYPSREAPVFLGVPGPPCTGDCNYTGFGQESLSEYDLNYPDRQCNDLWCSLFNEYENSTGAQPNFYLQATEPNNQVTFVVDSVTQNHQWPNGLVHCHGANNSACTNTTGLPAYPGQVLNGMYPQEGFSFTAGTGPNKTTYKIAQQAFGTNGSPTDGIIDANDFTCDVTTQCTFKVSNTLYVGDYLPDTIPFASVNYAQTIEVYFCDWEFAYNTQSGTNGIGCQAYSSQYSPLYKGVMQQP